MASSPPQGHSFLKAKMLKRNDVNNKPKRKSTMESVEYTILPSIDRDHDYISTDKVQHSDSDKEDKEKFKEENIEGRECKEKDKEDNEHKKENIEDREHKEEYITDRENTAMKRGLVQHLWK